MVFWTIVGLIVVAVLAVGVWIDRRHPGRAASGFISRSTDQDEAKAQAFRNRQSGPGSGQL